MSLFKTEKVIPIRVTDLGPVAQEVAGHFKQRGYQVECTQVEEDAWLVGITRGGIFKSAVGLKSALKVHIEARSIGTMVRAEAGVFGKQAVPTAITLFVAWPVVLTQAWGLIREAGLDDEAVRVVEVSLTRVQRLGRPTGAGQAAGATQGASATGAGPGMAAEPAVPSAGTVFCTSCGKRLEASAQYCVDCGQVPAS